MIVESFNYQSSPERISHLFNISLSQLTSWAQNRRLYAEMFDLACQAIDNKVPEALETFSKKLGTPHEEIAASVGFKQNIFYMSDICPVAGITLRSWYTSESKWKMFCGAVIGTHCLVFNHLNSRLERDVSAELNRLSISRAEVVSIFLDSPDAAVKLLNAAV